MYVYYHSKLLKIPEFFLFTRYTLPKAPEPTTFLYHRNQSNFPTKNIDNLQRRFHVNLLYFTLIMRNDYNVVSSSASYSLGSYPLFTGLNRVSSLGS